MAEIATDEELDEFNSRMLTMSRRSGKKLGRIDSARSVVNELLTSHSESKWTPAQCQAIKQIAHSLAELYLSVSSEDIKEIEDEVPM